MSNLLNPDGSPVELVPTIKWKDWSFPVRVVDERILKASGIQPATLTAAVLVQLNDKDNLLWAGLMALAKDIYARDPSKSTEFLDFVQAMGLHLRDGHGAVIDVEGELQKVLKTN